MTHKIAIVGLGPSGVFCALTILEELKKRNFSDFFITIFEKNSPLATILPTGNKRCNITNSIYDIKEFASNYPRGEKFLYSAFSRYSNYDALEYFSSVGIPCYTQDDGRIFPKSNSSSDVREKLLNRLNKFKNFKIVKENVSKISQIEDFDYKIIATGSRQAESLLKSIGQSFSPFKKALCGLKIENNIYPVGVSIKSLDGDFLFTPDGVVGPLIFKISSLNVDLEFPYEIKIKLFDENELYELIQKNQKKVFGSLVSMFLPKSFSKVHVKNFSKKASEISKKEILETSFLNLKVISTLKQGEIVQKGGVELNSIDKNFRSKENFSFWFCGEVLNIDGFCGGFNLQNCWSSGYLVAKDVVFDIMEKSKNKD